MRKAVKEKLEGLEMTDVYSMILFAVYKMKDIPEYSTLSELAYILDNDSLFNFLEYFGGMTIKVPTMKEFKLVINALLLYQYVDIEGIPFQQALKLLDSEDYKTAEIKACYFKVKEVLNNYDFRRK